MKLLGSLIICFTLIVTTLANGNLPLTMCMSGRAQGTESLNKSGSCEYGSYNGATGPGTFTATLNEYFYSEGVKCGDCFEVSGPKGKTIVRVVNFCSKGTCPSDEKPLFMLTPDAFQEISSDPLSVVYDAGFRKVSCDAQGPLKVQISEDSSKYYIKVLLFNNDVGIDKVSIKTKEMPKALLMFRQNSAQFVFSQAGREITFPYTITVTSQYGGSLTLNLNSLNPLDIHKFSSNFDLPKQAIIKDAPSTCSLSISPIAIYENGLTEGWNYWSSRSYSQINTTDSSMHSVGSSKSLSMILMGSSSCLTLARSGDFETNYFTGIKFNMRSNQTMKGLRVYFLNEQEKYWAPSTPVSTTWSTYTVPFSSLQHKEIESAISFANTENINVYIHIDNIQFIVSTKAVTTGYATTSNTGSETGLATASASTTASASSSSSSSSSSASGKTSGMTTTPTSMTTTATTTMTTTSASTSTENTSAASTTKTTSNPTTSMTTTTDSEGDHHSSSSAITVSLLSIGTVAIFSVLSL